MFFGKATHVIHNNIAGDPDHKLISYRFGFNQTHMILIILAFILAGYLFEGFLNAIRDYCGKNKHANFLDDDV